MKQMKRILSVAIMALLLLSFAAAAFAADRQYTVTLYAGDKGTFADGTTVKTFTKSYGEAVTLYNGPADVKLKDGNEKYYVMGVRIAGHEDLVSASAPVSVTVTRDEDYVIAYGVEGSDVAYTIKFVEAKTGKKLADDKTFYGNVGDNPVLAYQHINGYTPSYKNVAAPLQANAGSNVFTLEYVELVVPTATPTGGTGGNTGRSTGTGTTSDPASNTAPGAGSDTSAAPDASAAAGTDASAGTSANAEGPAGSEANAPAGSPEGAPADGNEGAALTDPSAEAAASEPGSDDDKGEAGTLATQPADNAGAQPVSEAKSGTNPAVIAAAAVGGLAVLGGGGYLIARNKKKETENG